MFTISFVFILKNHGKGLDFRANLVLTVDKKNDFQVIVFMG